MVSAARFAEIAKEHSTRPKPPPLVSAKDAKALAEAFGKPKAWRRVQALLGGILEKAVPRAQTRGHVPPPRY